MGFFSNNPLPATQTVGQPNYGGAYPGQKPGRSVGDVVGGAMGAMAMYNAQGVVNRARMKGAQAPQMRVAPNQVPRAPQMRAAPVRQPPPQPIMGQYSGGSWGSGPYGPQFMTSADQGTTWQASNQNPNQAGWTMTNNDPDGQGWMR